MDILSFRLHVSYSEVPPENFKPTEERFQNILIGKDDSNWVAMLVCSSAIKEKSRGILDNNMFFFTA